MYPLSGQSEGKSESPSGAKLIGVYSPLQLLHAEGLAKRQLILTGHCCLSL
jgi:hypothetical protein